MRLITDVRRELDSRLGAIRDPALLAVGAVLLVCSPVFPGLSRLVVMPALLLAPGYALLRLLGHVSGPRSISIAVPVSLVLVVCASLILDASGIRLGPLSLGSLLGAVTVLLLAGSYSRQLFASRLWESRKILLCGILTSLRMPWASNGNTVGVGSLRTDRDHSARHPVVTPLSLLDVPELDSWAAQWDQMVDSSPLPSPFLRSWWLTGAGGPGRHFLLAVDGERLLGGLALEQRSPILSTRVMADGSLCPDHLDLLAAPGHEEEVVGLFRDWLGRPGERLLDLNGIRAGSRLIEALPGRVRRGPTAVAPFTPLPGSPEEYRAALPSQFRKNLRAAAKRLAAEGLTHQTTRGEAVLPRLDILRELHQSQWGSRSNFLPVFDRFAAGFAGGCAADEVAVHELRNDDLVVATVTTFEVAGRVSLYQSARLTDHRWRDATRVLLAAIIEDACTRGFSEVDFLRGDESYKGKFAPNRREVLRLVAGKGATGWLGGVTRAATYQATRTAVRCVRFGRSTIARWKA